MRLSSPASSTCSPAERSFTGSLTLTRSRPVARSQPPEALWMAVVRSRNRLSAGRQGNCSKRQTWGWESTCPRTVARMEPAAE